MEAGTSGLDGFDGTTPVKGSSKRSTKREPKDPTKGRAITTPSGTRFQCERCPKNFSRIENLTRHQANHDEVGKFACVVCRKRFTRSDLLNRHRRIHGPGQENNTHVTKSEHSGSSPNTAPRSQDGQGMHQAVPQNGLPNMKSQSQSDGYQNRPLQPFQPANHGEYQSPFQAIQPPNTSSMLPPQTQGLTSLMEAALAPQDTFQFTPVENINPLLWDGFMRFGNNTTAYMGSYDADMSWTLDYLPSESPPNSLSNMDLINRYDEFGDNPYQYQAMQYSQQLSNETEDAEGEEEDPSDWPDKVSRPPTPDRHTRIIPLNVQPVSFQATINEANSSGLSSSSIQPFQAINDDLRSLLLSSLNGPNFRNDVSRPEISDIIFPPAQVLDYFLRLYIRYVHPRFPILHLPTFDVYKSSPLLLLAMMFLGSSHSTTDRGKLSRLFHDHLRVAIMRMQEVDKAFLRHADNIMTYFLLCLAGTWSGNKQQYEFAEGGRGILVTAGRRCRFLDCRFSARIQPEAFLHPRVSYLEASWLAWIETEKRKRLGLSIYIFDCQYPTLFNNQPYVSKAETTNCMFPCASEFWNASSPEMWKSLLGPLDTPPCTYYLHALNSCLLRKWITPPPPITPTCPLGRIILIYALHTHIFEWRQSASMLNPTGLMGTFGNSAHDMGEGLRERRRWLKDGLDSFGECYSHQENGGNPAVSLLHHLGYISLDVSLSDMHLVAGRSVNTNDASFAEENLKFWANSEISDETMGHVVIMLELCFGCIKEGGVGDASFEVAVALFTGGMVCWAYAKLRMGGGNAGMIGGNGWESGEVVVWVERVGRASVALMNMGCWRMCSIYGRILQELMKGKGRADDQGGGGGGNGL